MIAITKMYDILNLLIKLKDLVRFVRECFCTDSIRIFVTRLDLICAFSFEMYARTV